MPHLNIDGIRFHYRVQGDGPPVIFTHGGGSSGAQWRKVCEILSQRFRTFTVDHYGHGGTDPCPGAIDARTHFQEFSRDPHKTSEFGILGGEKITRKVRRW